MSSGWPKRPIGVWRRKPCSTVGRVYAIVVMPVSVDPGAMAFTRMPRAPSSIAATRVNISTPPFEAQYAESPVAGM
jgi:hypothetical protein